MTAHLALRLHSGLLQHLDALLLLLHHLGFGFIFPQELSVAPFSVLQLLPNNLRMHKEGVQLEEAWAAAQFAFWAAFWVKELRHGFI